ncbi:TspO/MBR family protein [Robiginitalea sediminis]|uniref:TspO/MBR family protein n=1 Tax=Robiginitalea sediminis TaxID=1982593 RepID=UPI001E3414FD|nr:TspO/MBR family protein [Robiginitalea sediminis]
MLHSRKKYRRILIAVGVCLLIGFLSGYATQSSVTTWYAGLNKPWFTPPNWLFGPVWTLLYILMGIAAGLVWARGLHHIWVKTALYHFGFQLLLNGSWSLVFFGLQEPFWAFLIIMALLVLIILTLKWFRVVSKPAGWLMLPYLAWVLFASVLNLSIVQLN